MKQWIIALLGGIEPEVVQITVYKEIDFPVGTRVWTMLRNKPVEVEIQSVWLDHRGPTYYCSSVKFKGTDKYSTSGDTHLNREEIFSSKEELVKSL